MAEKKRKKPELRRHYRMEIPEMSNGERADLYRKRKKKSPTWLGSTKRKLR
ncbi:MAG: hypothetical protein ABI572_13035 [Actinomycetota bacterium]